MTSCLFVSESKSREGLKGKKASQAGFKLADSDERHALLQNKNGTKNRFTHYWPTSTSWPQSFSKQVKKVNDYSLPEAQ